MIILLMHILLLIVDTIFLASGVNRSGTNVSSSMIQEISNGMCRFSPTSRKGKWIFVLQTLFLSFTPIILLIVQNSLTFYDTVKWKQDILYKVDN